jgi:hypothetical protein
MRPTFLFCMLLCIPASAQTNAVIAEPHKQENNVTNTTITLLPDNALQGSTISPTRPRIFDRDFFLLAGMVTTATVMDITTTSSCLSGYSTCREANPLLGSHPSGAKIYGVNLSLLAGEIFASAWLRHQMPHRKLWMIPPLVGTAGHGLAAALNVRTMNQSNPSR